MLVDNESADEWFTCLTFMSDPEFRAKLADWQLDRARAQTIDLHSHLWEQVYNERGRCIEPSAACVRQAI
jgi:hypothetical protein